MYIIKLGQSYMADYYGPFETKAEAIKWYDTSDCDAMPFEVIWVRNPNSENDYA